MWGYGPQFGMMGGYGYGYGIMHMAFWAIVLIAIIVGIVWLVRSTGSGSAGTARRSPGLDVLEERYARGDIGRDEYLQKKRDLAD